MAENADITWYYIVYLYIHTLVSSSSSLSQFIFSLFQNYSPWYTHSSITPGIGLSLSR